MSQQTSLTKLSREELLVLLVEECGEVIQAATKCLRFGFDVDHGTGYGNNSKALAKESGELAAIVCELGLPIDDCFISGMSNKIERAKTAKEKYGVKVCTT